MKTTTVPAQVTTVEDTIVGSISFTQLLLGLMSVFMVATIYILLPAHMKFTLYKVPLIALSFLSCGILAIRFKGKLILEWLMLVMKFNSRPAIYLHNKNDIYLRSVIVEKKVSTKQAPSLAKKKVTVPSISISRLVELEQLLRKGNFAFRFDKKGALSVVTE